jgi:hypothetical protein
MSFTMEVNSLESQNQFAGQTLGTDKALSQLIMSEKFVTILKPFEAHIHSGSSPR